MISGYVCEHCGYSEPYGNDIGQNAKAVVRARIVKHEQRCEKNPLVKTIKDIRESANFVATKMMDNIRGSYDGKLYEEVNQIIRKTYDCFFDQSPPPKERKGPNPKPIKPTTRRRIDIKPGAVAVGSNVQVVSRRKPGAIRAKRKGASSEYLGVTLNTSPGKWVAQISRGDKRWHGGYHALEEEAAIAVQEKLGNTAEADRIRKILIDKTAHTEAAIDIEIEDKKQEAVAAAGLVEIKGEFTWQWVCKGCGDTVKVRDDKCRKCNGSSFEKIKVLKDPQAFLDRPEGRHNIPTGVEKRNAKKVVSK